MVSCPRAREKHICVAFTLFFFSGTEPNLQTKLCVESQCVKQIRAEQSCLSWGALSELHPLFSSMTKLHRVPGTFSLPNEYCHSIRLGYSESYQI